MQEKTNIYKRTLWRNDNIDFLFDSEIIEYDIHSAGLSLAKEYKLLPEWQIKQLEKMTKTERNVKMGLIQKRDKNFTKKLNECFMLARKAFIISNELELNDIISIKKDAIFVYDKECINIDFGEIHFISKNIYTSYIYLNHIEFYINTDKNKIDLKGLGQGNTLKNIHFLHDKYILNFILKFASIRESSTDKRVINHFLSQFVYKYREHLLPHEYYRELNQVNAYKLKKNDENNVNYIDEIDDTNKIDISFNYLNYIVPLVGLYL